jgi:hypothetical protein
MIPPDLKCANVDSFTIIFAFMPNMPAVSAPFIVSPFKLHIYMSSFVLGMAATTGTFRYVSLKMPLQGQQEAYLLERNNTSVEAREPALQHDHAIH